MLLLFFRNQRCNVLQSINSVFLFSSNANHFTYSIFSRVGAVISYSTTIKRLKLLAKDAKSKLRGLGKKLALGLIHLLLEYDNVNQYQRAWKQTVANKSTMTNGTAATVIVMHGVPPGALDGYAYRERRFSGMEQSLTVEQLINDVKPDHIRGIGVGAVLRALVTHVPSLSRHKPSVSDFFKTRYAVHRLPDNHKTEFYTMETSGFDEATTSGNQSVLQDLVRDQLGLPVDLFEKALIPIGGDQMTIARLRSLLDQTDQDVTAFDRNDYVLPLVQLWHMKWAFLRSIYRCHWSDTIGKGVVGLRRDATGLGRKINPVKCDFYPSHRMVEVRFQALVLHSCR